MMLLRFCILLFLAAPTFAQSFTIEGSVVDHANNRPLKDVVVTIAPVQQRRDTVSFRTPADGRFQFNQLQPGKYQLWARKHGYGNQSFQQDGQFSTAIAVGPGLDAANIVFPLSLAGSITGSITDDQNDPVAQAQVLLFIKHIVSGEVQTVLLNQRLTNSSGQFRFADLSPGTYFLAAEAHPWYAQNNPLQPPSQVTDENKELDVAFPITYYPSVTDPAAASPIAITEGSSANLSIALRAVPAVHIQITGAHPGAGTSIGFNVTHIGIAGWTRLANTQMSADGDRFEISGLAPGRYLISPQIAVNRAFVMDGTTILPGPQLGNTSHATFKIMDLAGNETLDVSDFKQLSLTGRIRFEGTAAPPLQPFILLSEVGSEPRIALPALSDGSFKLGEGDVLLPGHYRLLLANAPGFYLKSVEAKGAAASPSQIEIPETGSVQLSVVAASGASSLKGTAFNNDKPAPGAMVLLIPKDLRRTDLLRRDQSDSDGTFTLPDVPPGDYKLLALDDGHDLEYQNAAVIEPYLNKAQPLTMPLSKDESEVRVAIQSRHPREQ